MDADLVRTVGEIAGIGGLVTAMVAIVFRRVIGKLVGAKLTKNQTYRLLMTIIVSSSIIAVLGIGAWAFVEVSQESEGPAEGNTRPAGGSEKWQATRMILEYLSAYKQAKERGPTVFGSKNEFLVRLESLDFPVSSEISRARDKAISVIIGAQVAETGMRQDMAISRELIDALDELFYLIRLEAMEDGLKDWPF